MSQKNFVTFYSAGPIIERPIDSWDADIAAEMAHHIEGPTPWSFRFSTRDAADRTIGTSCTFHLGVVTHEYQRTQRPVESGDVVLDWRPRARGLTLTV